MWPMMVSVDPSLALENLQPFLSLSSSHIGVVAGGFLIDLVKDHEESAAADDGQLV